MEATVRCSLLLVVKEMRDTTTREASKKQSRNGFRKMARATKISPFLQIRVLFQGNGLIRDSGILLLTFTTD
jgi:hypothetical protein